MDRAAEHPKGMQRNADSWRGMQRVGESMLAGDVSAGWTYVPGTWLGNCQRTCLAANVKLGLRLALLAM